MLKLVIFAKSNSQLGNRLTMHAHLMAACRERRARLLNPTLGDYAPFFVGTRQRIAAFRVPGAMIGNAPGPSVPRRVRRMWYLLTRLGYRCAKVTSWIPGFPIQAASARVRWRDCRLRDVFDHHDRRGARVLFFQGWHARDHALCHRHAASIRAVLCPLPALRRRADALLADIRCRADHVLGVHIRHGDYRTHAGGRLFFPCARYRAWMQEYAAAFPGKRVAFLIASDARLHAADFVPLDVVFAPGQQDVDASGNHPGKAIAASIVEDNYALAGCDAILGTVSTFSSWAAFWGGRPLLQVTSADEHALPERFAVPIGPD